MNNLLVALLDKVGVNWRSSATAPAASNSIRCLVCSACGHAEPRTSKAEARHQRKNALGVGPQRQ